MTGPDQRMTIGVFARATGVTTSALRFYDDCGLVRPAMTDAATGYRHYTPAQIDHVVLIRQLREVGLPLVDVRRLLTAPAEVAESWLADHLRGLEDALQAKRANAVKALTTIRNQHRNALSVAGTTLREAIGQVALAADPHGSAPVLAGVLIEATDDGLRLAATDRYRLAVRLLPAEGRPRNPAAAVVDASRLHQARSWIGQQDTVDLRLGSSDVRLDGPAGHLILPTIQERFPHYELVLQHLPAALTQAVVSRDSLIEALESHTDAHVDMVLNREMIIRSQSQRSQSQHSQSQRSQSQRSQSPHSRPQRSRSQPETSLTADITGPPVTVGFRHATLQPAVIASVGPDVMFQISRPDLPVVVRSADDGDLTTLVMPVLPHPSDTTRDRHDPAT